MKKQTKATKKVAKVMKEYGAGKLPIHKPAGKPGVLAAIMRPPLTRGDTSPVGKPTQMDTRKK